MSDISDKYYQLDKKQFLLIEIKTYGRISKR